MLAWSLSLLCAVGLRHDRWGDDIIRQLPSRDGGNVLGPGVFYSLPGHKFLPKHEYLAPLEAILDLGPEFLTPPEANLVYSGWVGLPL